MRVNFLIFLGILINLILLFIIPINFYKSFKVSEIDNTQKIDISKNMFKDCLSKKGPNEKCTKSVIDKGIINHGFDQNYLDLIYYNLNDLLANHSINEDDCHIISHEIGFKTNSVTKNIEKSLTYDPFKVSTSFLCANGFIHGTLGNNIESVKIQEKIILKMADLFQSPEFQSKRNQYISGMHEIGHYIFQNDPDINSSIETCTNISKTRENELSCITGIFMENFDQLSRVGLNDSKHQINQCNNYTGLAGYSCFFVSNDRTSDLIKSQKQYLDLCNSYGLDPKHYSCNRRMLMEAFGKKIPNALTNSTNFCMGQNSLEYKINCLYLLSFDELRFHPEVNKMDLSNLLCSNFSVVNYLRCKKKLNTDFSGNMYFALPENIDLSVPSFFNSIF